MNQLKVNNELAKIVSDYSYKVENATNNIQAFEAAYEKIKSDSCVLGTYSGINPVPHIS